MKKKKRESFFFGFFLLRLTDVYGLSWTFFSQCWYNFLCNYSFVTLFEMYINKKEITYYSFKSRLVIGTSRTVGSAKKFVRITSGFGGGEFTKTLRQVCTYQKLKFSFLLLEYCKIRECYAVVNAFTIRNMYSLFLYMKCNSRKINRPTKNMTKIVTLLHF
jgi:hypothetical protein